METTDSIVAEYLQRFRKGDREGAFHNLLEKGHEILPVLMAAFHSECDSQVREFLVEVIWQHRQPSVIPFLGEALQDPEPEVWKQALDGLVTLASLAALEIYLDFRMTFGHEDGAVWLRRIPKGKLQPSLSGSRPWNGWFGPAFEKQSQDSGLWSQGLGSSMLSFVASEKR